jgi:hypothetical protein
VKIQVEAFWVVTLCNVMVGYRSQRIMWKRGGGYGEGLVWDN